MANKPKNQKPTEESVTRAEELMEFGRNEIRAEMEKAVLELGAAADEREAAGVLKKIYTDRAYNDLIEAIVLYRVNQTKEHKKAGMTFIQFCESVGIARERAYEKIRTIKPLYQAFCADFAHFLGFTFNEIRYLGQAVCAEIAQIKDGMISYKGEQTPLDAEEFQAVFEDIKDELKKLKEERDLDRRTHERRMADEKKHSQKLEHVVAKFEREAAKQGLTLEEDAFIKKVENLRIGFDGYMLSLDPDRIEELLPKNKPTPRMISAYITALKYMKMQILAAHDAAIESYADPSMLPEEEWQPPPDARAPVYPKHRSNKAEA